MRATIRVRLSGAGGLAALVLPAVTLGMRSVAVLARMTRGAMREALASDFIRTARAKGLPETVGDLRARQPRRGPAVCES